MKRASHRDRMGRRLSLVVAHGLLLILVVGLLGLRAAGYEYISIRGDSMEPTFSSGSLLLAQPTAPEDIQVGDIIFVPGTSEGMPAIVHRVVDLLDDGEHIFATTMGDNNPVPDADQVVLDKPVLRIVWAVPYLGWCATPPVAWGLLGLGALLGLCVLLRRRGLFEKEKLA